VLHLQGQASIHKKRFYDTSIDNVIAHIAEEFNIVRHEERWTNTRLAYGTLPMLINASKSKCNASFETDISMRGVKFDAHHANKKVEATHAISSSPI